MGPLDNIALNLNRIRESIAVTAQRAGRDVRDIRLITVSKNQSSDAIAAAIAAGQTEFGESTVQAALTKISHYANSPITWHFIGHVQTNKAKFIPGNFTWLHSLDNLDLARKLSQRAQEQSANLNILIEVNISRDPKKHGLVTESLFDFVEHLLKENLPAISWRGLMTIAPHAAPEPEIREYFAKLRRLRDECCQRFALPGFTELSMGMSSDYVEAIKEGATQVRIGTAIFGARDYLSR